MRRTRRLALAAGVLLSACTAEGIGRDEPVAEDRDVEDRTPYEQLDNTAQSQAEGYGGPAPAPVTPVQGGATIGGPLTATGQFVGVNGNPPPGSVTLTQAENGTRLSILVNRSTSSAPLRVSIVGGNCQSPGAVVQSVPQTIQLTNGTGTVDTVVPVQTAQLLDGRHAIQLTGAQGGTVVGCADLPAQR